MRFNHKKFFDGYKTAFGKVSNEQTAGLDFLLSKFEEDNWTDVRLIAYCFATIVGLYVKWLSYETAKICYNCNYAKGLQRLC